MSKYYKTNKLTALFRRVFREQKSEEGELLISYAESLLYKMSREDFPAFRRFLQDFELEVSADDLMEWWEEND